MPNTLTRGTLATTKTRRKLHDAMETTKISGQFISNFSGFEGHRKIIGFSRNRNLPVRGRAQGGGDGNLVIEEDPIDWTFRPADLQGVHNAFAVFVTGDSMVPKYKNRDIAYIHPSEKPRRGRYVLVETKSRGGFIKLFEGWENDFLILSQHNPTEKLRFMRSDIMNVMLVIGSLDA